MTRTASQAVPAGRREGGITLSALRTFVAVAEAVSFSRAAEALGISQPSVSMQLAGLEQACGVLLMRRKPGLTLTEAGQDLLVRARLIVSRLDEFEGSVDSLRSLRRGRLSIGLSTPHIAMPLIASFSAKYQSIDLSTAIGNTDALLDDTARCRIDVGIMTLLGPLSQFACTLIAAPRLSLCVRRDDPLAQRASLRPAELFGERFVMREEGSMTRRIVEAAFAEDGLSPRTAIVLQSREAMKEAVAAGLGIGAVFDAENLHDERLVSVPLLGSIPASGVYAVALKESLDIPAVRAFFDHVAGSEPAGESVSGAPARPSRENA